MTDQALQTFAADKSENAFRELVERYSQMVYSVAFRTLNNSADAQDVTQLVFTRLAQKAYGLRKEVILSGWLYRATLMEAQNYRRKSQRRFQHEEEIQQMIKESSSDNQDSPWETVRVHLDQAIGNLPAKLQNAVVLHFLEGKTQRETALLLGCDEKTVQKRISRSVEKIRSVFSRRGVTISSVVLASYLQANRVEASPATLNEVVLKTVREASSKGLATAGIAGAIANFIISSISPKVALTVAALIAGSCAIELAKYGFEKNPSNQTAQESADTPTSNPKTIITSISELKPLSAQAMHPSLSFEERFMQIIEQIKREGLNDKNESTLEQVLTDIAKGNPRLFLSLYKKIPSGEIPRRPEGFERFFDDWISNLFFMDLAKINLPQAAEIASQLPQGRGRHVAVTQTIQVWAGTNPKAAAVWLQGLPLDEAAEYGMLLLVSNWSYKDPRGAAEWLEQITVKPIRSANVESLLWNWGKKDLKAATEWIQTLPENFSIYSKIELQQKVLLSTAPLVSDWHNSSQVSARLTSLLNLPASSIRDDQIKMTFGDWQLNTQTSSGAIKEIIQRAAQLPEGELRNYIFSQIAGYATPDEVSTATSLIASISPNRQNNDPEVALNTGAVLAKNYLRSVDVTQSTEMAIQWAKQLPAGQKEGALNAILCELADKNRNLFLDQFVQLTEKDLSEAPFDEPFEKMDGASLQDAISYLQQSAASSEQKAIALSVAFSSWSSNNDEIENAMKAASKITDPKIAEKVWPSIAYISARKTDDTTFAWISNLPTGVPKDTTIQAALERLASSVIDPKEITSWINTIQNDAIRNTAIKNIYSKLTKCQGSDVATKWINQQNIRQSLKNGIIQEVKASTQRQK